MSKDKDGTRVYHVKNKSGQETEIRQHRGGAAEYERTRDTPAGRKREIWERPAPDKGKK